MPSKRCNDTQVIFGLTLVVQLDFNVDFAVNINSHILDCEVINILVLHLFLSISLAVKAAKVLTFIFRH
jgi:hypothetical protein